MRKSRLKIYMRGWLVWLYSVAMMPMVFGQQPLLADESTNLLHVQPYFIQETPQHLTKAAIAPPAKPTLLGKPVSISEPNLTADFWICKPQLEPRTTVYRPTTIEWHFYNNNIFDIDDDGNPFSLPSNKSHLAFASPEQSTRLSAVSLAWRDVFSTDETTFSYSTTSNTNSVWLSFVVLAILGFAATQLSLYRQDIRKTFQAFMNVSSAGQIYREQRYIWTPSNISAHIMYSMSLGLFAFLAIQYIHPNHEYYSFSILLLCALGAGISYLLKFLQLKGLAQLLPYAQELSFYSFIVSNTNKVLGLAVLPFALLVAYTPENLQPVAFYMSLFGLAGIYAYRAFRAMTSIGDLILFHKFHFFIYLCTVELAPLVILLKLLSIF